MNINIANQPPVYQSIFNKADGNASKSIDTDQALLSAKKIAQSELSPQQYTAFLEYLDEMQWCIVIDQHISPAMLKEVQSCRYCDI